MVKRDTGQLIASDVQTAYSFRKRLKGLMFAKSLPNNFAMHIAPCSSIHTFFMKCRIDILYLSQKNEIVGMEEDFAPGKIGKRFSNVHSVVELPSGKIKTSAVNVGQAVDFVKREHEEVT
ncbi:DUF192 domain-containing protein [Virgibacillus salinus]|uniref:DUF192 domain-containing protein n=1 Tax=Virgibacillus salinus TaxID=553311 RepID=UPI0020C8F5B0|nr:DUF192 domain-containing protein [Virgibacillus salinus]